MRPARRTAVDVYRLSIAVLAACVPASVLDASPIDPAIRPPFTVSADTVEVSERLLAGALDPSARPLDTERGELGARYEHRWPGRGLRTTREAGRESWERGGARLPSARRATNADYGTLFVVGVGLVGVGLRRFTAL